MSKNIVAIRPSSLFLTHSVNTNFRFGDPIATVFVYLRGMIHNFHKSGARTAENIQIFSNIYDKPFKVASFRTYLRKNIIEITISSGENGRESYSQYFACQNPSNFGVQAQKRIIFLRLKTEILYSHDVVKTRREQFISQNSNNLIYWVP